MRAKSSAETGLDRSRPTTSAPSGASNARMSKDWPVEEAAVSDTLEKLVTVTRKAERGHTIYSRALGATTKHPSFRYARRPEPAVSTVTMRAFRPGCRKAT